MLNVYEVTFRNHKERIKYTSMFMSQGLKVCRVNEYTISISKRDIVTDGGYSRGY